jgi:hypothetical protein
MQAVGMRAELLDRDETCRLEPQLAPDALLGALYNPDEGMLDPFKLVHAYALRGRALGLEVWTHTRVSRIEVRGGRAFGVATPRGDVPAQWVILAAGAWSRELGRTAGLDLPLQWVHGEAAITERLRPIAQNAMTSAAFFEATEAADEQTVGFCIRQRPHGNVMIGEAARFTRGLSRGATASTLPAGAAEARRWLPTLRRAAVIRAWAFVEEHLRHLPAPQPSPIRNPQSAICNPPVGRRAGSRDGNRRDPGSEAGRILTVEDVRRFAGLMTCMGRRKTHSCHPEQVGPVKCVAATLCVQRGVWCGTRVYPKGRFAIAGCSWSREFLGGPAHGEASDRQDGSGFAPWHFCLLLSSAADST